MSRAKLADATIVDSRQILTARVVKSSGGSSGAWGQPTETPRGFVDVEGRDPFFVLPLQETTTQSVMAGRDHNRDIYRLWALLPSFNALPADTHEYIRVPEIGVMNVLNAVRFQTDGLCRLEAEVVE